MPGACRGATTDGISDVGHKPGTPKPSHSLRIYLDEHKYWTMGAPLVDTILFNRKVLKDDDC